MPRHGEGDDRLGMFEYQPPAVLNQANPIINTWYPLLPATDNVRVYDVTVQVAVAGETLEVRGTLDGEIIVAEPFACVFATNYYVHRYMNALNQTDRFALAVAAINEAFLVEGHNVAIDVRKSTAAGAGNLTGIASFGVLTRI